MRGTSTIGETIGRTYGRRGTISRALAPLLDEDV